MKNSHISSLIDDAFFETWLLDCIKDAIIVVNKNTKILYVNSQWEKLIGISLKQAREQKLLDIEPYAILNTVVKTGKPVIGKRCKHHHHKDIEILTSAFPIFKDSCIIGGIGIFREISQLRQILSDTLKLKRTVTYYENQLKLKSSLPDYFSSMIGESPEFVKALTKAYRASASNATVLIFGESGVGKNLLARAIHGSGHRKDKPIVEINCAAIPDTLLESELFGYMGGSFTGANKEGKVGKAERANGGTLFLDEIGDMSIPMQSKLLKLIEEGNIDRIGDTKQTHVDIRFITATNRDLRSMMKNGNFREDLYYRLNVIPIYLPPLRERREDVPLLIDFFINKYTRIYNKKVDLAMTVYNLLNHYYWPGNIRELNNVIEHAVLMCPGRIIKTEHLPWPLNARSNQKLSLDDFDSTDEKCSKLKYLVEEVEKRAIRSALKTCNNNKTKAIQTLGLTRRVFYHKIKKYNIDLKNG